MSYSLQTRYIIEDIKYRDYSKAAAKMRYEALDAKRRSRKQGQIVSVTIIEKTLKSTHLKLLPLRELGRSLDEIAEETYEQTREALGLDKFDEVIELGDV
jgi:hypothetical protein